jgi:hypothetical protein
MPYGPPAVPPPPAGAAQTPTQQAQVVFDTVTGPNVRLKDNLIQLLCCVVGAAIGGGIGAYYAPSDQPSIGILIGVVGGLVAALFLSGAVIGVIRFFTAVKKRR